MHTENEYHRGEIFFINEGESSGSEQGGARPGIIVSNDIGNKHAPIVEVVYLTSREKKLMPTHVRIKSSPIPFTDLITASMSFTSRAFTEAFPSSHPLL